MTALDDHLGLDLADPTFAWLDAADQALVPLSLRDSLSARRDALARKFALAEQLDAALRALDEALAGDGTPGAVEDAAARLVGAERLLELLPDAPAVPAALLHAVAERTSGVARTAAMLSLGVPPLFAGELSHYLAWHRNDLAARPPTPSEADSAAWDSFEALVGEAGKFAAGAAIFSDLRGPESTALSSWLTAATEVRQVGLPALVERIAATRALVAKADAARPGSGLRRECMHGLAAFAPLPEVLAGIAADWKLPGS